MPRNSASSIEIVASLVRDALGRGASVNIDGLGTFRPHGTAGFTFHPPSSPKVFIAYIHEDGAVADRIFDALSFSGFDPWMDRRKLTPGQNWPLAIKNAMQTSDFALLCFSRSSVKKKGGFQAEIRYALECAAQLPLDDIFIIPVRFDDCRIPPRIQCELQYVDLFPDWELGLQRILRVIRAQLIRRKAA